MTYNTQIAFFNKLLSFSSIRNYEVSNVIPVSGGCINSCFCLETANQKLFIKLNEPSLAPMFEKEAYALKALDGALKTPEVHDLGIYESKSYLILEWIEKSHHNQRFWHSFGSGLALQHNKTSTHYGYDHDNYIGRLPQSNKLHTSWHAFFISERLSPQIELAASNDHRFSRQRMMRKNSAICSSDESQLFISEPLVFLVLIRF